MSHIVDSWSPHPALDTVQAILSKVIEIPGIRLRLETAFPKAALILTPLRSLGSRAVLQRASSSVYQRPSSART